MSTSTQALSPNDRPRLIGSLTSAADQIFTGHGQLGLLVDFPKPHRSACPPPASGRLHGQAGGCPAAKLHALSELFRLPIGAGLELA